MAFAELALLTEPLGFQHPSRERSVPADSDKRMIAEAESKPVTRPISAPRR